MKRIVFSILLVDIGILLFAGITPSILYNDWSWFSRSGSGLTAFGVVLAYLDISGVIEKIGDVLSSSVRKVLVEKGLELKNGSLEKIDNIIKDQKTSMIKKFRLLEFTTIFIGTIIWGYGDKLPYIFS
jgi:hypothetical protein